MLEAPTWAGPSPNIVKTFAKFRCQLCSGVVRLGWLWLRSDASPQGAREPGAAELPGAALHPLPPHHQT